MAKVQSIRGQISPDQNGTRKQRSKPDREATKCVSAHLPADIYWQLKELAASERVEMQTILADAANALFAAKGKRVIPVMAHGARLKHLTHSD